MTKIAAGVVLGGSGGTGGESGAEGVPIGNEVAAQQLKPENPCLLEERVTACEYSSPGVMRLFFARRSQIEAYYFGRFNNRNIITKIEAVSGGVSWLEWKVERDAVRFAENQVNTESGPAFAQKIDLAYGPMKKETRQALRPLVGIVGHVCLFQDMNFRWWLAGEAKGMKTTERLTQTGDKNGRNNYEFAITSTEPEPIREVLGTWVKSAILVPFTQAAGGGQIGTLSGVIISNFQGIKIQDL